MQFIKKELGKNWVLFY